MDSQEILKFCLEKGFLLDKEVLGLFDKTEDSESVKLIIERIKEYTHQKIITKSFFNQNKEKVFQIFSTLPKENQQQLEGLKIKLGLSIEISKEFSNSRKEDNNAYSKLKQESSNVKILSPAINVIKKLEVDDFTKYLRNRFLEMRKILLGNSSIKNPVSINKLSNNKQGISIIGIVSDKTMTKNKNLILSIPTSMGLKNLKRKYIIQGWKHAFLTVHF